MTPTPPISQPAGGSAALDMALDAESRELLADLGRQEDQLMAALPSDAPLDPKRRRRVELTRPEIRGQPDAIRSTLQTGREALSDAVERIAASPPDRVCLVGCGDSIASMVAVRSLLEVLLGVPCEPMQALDFAYYHSPLCGPGTLIISLSSSGTTTRTVEAVLAGKARGAQTLGLSNTPGSALLRISDAGLIVQAERKGWPTQSSTAAMALLCEMGFGVARAMGRYSREVTAVHEAFLRVPDLMARVIDETEGPVEEIARQEAERPIYLFSGGGPSYAAAMFGAAKVKECTPNHALAVPLEEYHHYNSQKEGDPLMLVAPAGASVDRARETAFQGKHWGGRVHAVVTEDESALNPFGDSILRLPALPETLSPFLFSIPPQLFAYHVATEQFRRHTET